MLASLQRKTGGLQGRQDCHKKRFSIGSALRATDPCGSPRPDRAPGLAPPRRWGPRHWPCALEIPRLGQECASRLQRLGEPFGVRRAGLAGVVQGEGLAEEDRNRA